MAWQIALFTVKCFYLLMPAYFANMAPVIAKNINFLKLQVDFNRKIKGKPVLGANKTFRGLFFGITFAIAIGYIQFHLYNIDFFRDISFIGYKNWLQFSFLMGFGALTGDLVKSFFKRRLNIKPGDKFIPFDQTDFVVGALIFVMPVFDLTIKIFVTSLIISFVSHIIVNHIAFYLNVRNEKW